MPHQLHWYLQAAHLQSGYIHVEVYKYSLAASQLSPLRCRLSKHSVMFGLQACDDPLDRKRAVYLLRSLGAAEAAPSLGTLLQLYETLDDFSLHAVEVVPT